VQAGDRQQVGQTGITEGLFDLFGNRAALAGNQRRSHAAGRAGKDGGDPPRHFVTKLPPALARPAVALRAGDPMRAAKGVPDPADAGEIKLALKVAPARQNLRGHRIEHRLEADAVARVELVAAWRDMHP
jgi:hypothetical protein